MALAKNFAFFDGFDTGDKSGLWLTDGSVAGTSESGGLGDAGVMGVSTLDGLFPTSILTVFHTAFFSGVDANNNETLWVSDGTAAGTVEVGGLNNAGIAGAAATNFRPESFVGYRGKFLFNAQDTAGNYGLWITDGTAAGTTEVGGLSNQGVSNASTTGLDPSSPAAFSGKIFFSGEDSTNSSGLWVTDGTAAGTTELGGVGNAGVTGTSGGLDPFWLVVANGRLFFEGRDASDDFGLWVSDGTAAGTTEIGGLADQGVGGANANGLSPQSVVQFDGKVFFGGKDSSGNYGLWVSDGTAAGTVELGGLKDQGIANAD